MLIVCHELLGVVWVFIVVSVTRLWSRSLLLITMYSREYHSVFVTESGFG